MVGGSGEEAVRRPDSPTWICNNTVGWDEPHEAIQSCVVHQGDFKDIKAQ
jgi:hypothetical protein